MPEPRGTSQEQDYDLFAHMTFETEKEDDAEPEEDDEGEPETAEPV